MQDSNKRKHTLEANPGESEARTRCAKLLTVSKPRLRSATCGIIAST